MCTDVAEYGNLRQSKCVRGDRGNGWCVTHFRLSLLHPGVSRRYGRFHVSTRAVCFFNLALSARSNVFQQYLTLVLS